MAELYQIRRVFGLSIFSYIQFFALIDSSTTEKLCPLLRIKPGVNNNCFQNICQNGSKEDSLFSQLAWRIM